jgi:hypothetical protein
MVISERGALVGTHVLGEDRTSGGRLKAYLVAGPKQKIREIEIVVPEDYHRVENITAWHKLVKKRLKLK